MKTSRIAAALGVVLAAALVGCAPLPEDAPRMCPLDDAARVHDDAASVREAAVAPDVAVVADVTPVATPLDRNAGAAPYNARGDGTTDDTAAIQRALDDAGRDVALTGSPPPRAAVVFLPAGNYLVRTHLAVPAFVALTGAYRAPPAWAGLAGISGTTLLAVEGAGAAGGAAFVTLAADATVQDLAVLYPEQNRTNVPTAYPWAIRAGGPRVTVRDVGLINPWQGVDLASAASDGHLVHGVYGQPLNIGILVDHCAGGGRIEDVHFFPFWNGDRASTATRAYQSASAVGLFLLHDEGETITSFFEIGMNTGIRFGGSHTDTCAAGLTCGTNGGTMTQIAFDSTGVCLDVYDTTATGWRISGVNCVSDAAGVRVGIWRHSGSNAMLAVGGASFWGPNVANVVLWQAAGTLALYDAVLNSWATGHAAIDVSAGSVNVDTSQFNNAVHGGGTVAIAQSGSGHAAATANLMVGYTLSGPVGSRGNAM